MPFTVLGFRPWPSDSRGSSLIIRPTVTTAKLDLNPQPCAWNLQFCHCVFLSWRYTSLHNVYMAEITINNYLIWPDFWLEWGVVSTRPFEINNHLFCLPSINIQIVVLVHPSANYCIYLLCNVSLLLHPTMVVSGVIWMIEQSQVSSMNSSVFSTRPWGTPVFSMMVLELLLPTWTVSQWGSSESSCWWRCWAAEAFLSDAEGRCICWCILSLRQHAHQCADVNTQTAYTNLTGFAGVLVCTDSA